jgi:hypothetical protein
LSSHTASSALKDWRADLSKMRIGPKLIRNMISAAFGEALSVGAWVIYDLKANKTSYSDASEHAGTFN